MSLTSETPIRVMRIISRMNIGGPAVQISGLLRGINLMEFDHRLYTGFCSTGEADYLELVATDLSAVRVDGFGRRLNLIGDIKAFLILVNEIHKFKPDIIHTHTAKAGILGRVASIFSMHPSIRVHTFHGHLLSGYFGTFKRSMVVITEKILASHTDVLLAVGDKVRQDLQKAGIGLKKRFEIMPPGLTIGPLITKEKSQEDLGLSIGKLQCAFIGRVTQIKRPDRFLDVVSEIKKRGVVLDFLIAGDGELLNLCRERIARENLPVKVLGWQSDIEKVLSAADIVILTSDNEGTPLSLIQAGMAGLPTVTTNVGSVTEIVLDGHTGIVTGFDVQEIANSLEKLVSDKSLRSNLGNAAKEYTAANFGVQRAVNDHKVLYKNLLINRAKS